MLASLICGSDLVRTRIIFFAIYFVLDLFSFLFSLFDVLESANLDLDCFVGFFSIFLIISSSIFLLALTADIRLDVLALTAAANLELSLDLLSLPDFFVTVSPSESEP